MVNKGFSPFGPCLAQTGQSEGSLKGSYENQWIFIDQFQYMNLSIILTDLVTTLSTNHKMSSFIVSVLTDPASAAWGRTGSGTRVGQHSEFNLRITRNSRTEI